MYEKEVECAQHILGHYYHKFISNIVKPFDTNKLFKAILK